MKSVSSLRYAFSGGAQSAAGLAPLGQHGAFESKKTFAYTGSEQKFKVPSGVTGDGLIVVLW
jgi:hypothetical protein